MDKTNINLNEQGGNDANENTEVKTFTQEQVDNIVEKRLAKEKRKLMSMISDDEEVKAELTKNKLQLEVAKHLNDGNYPSCLTDLMDYTSKEACAESYERITKVFDKALEEAVDNRFKRAGRNPNRGPSHYDNEKDDYYKPSDSLRAAFGLNSSEE